MGAVLQEIITLLTEGLTSMASGIGQGLGDMAKAIFLDTTGEATKLSTFGGLIIIFAGVSLAIGLSKWVVGWLTSLGN